MNDHIEYYELLRDVVGIVDPAEYPESWQIANGCLDLDEECLTDDPLVIADELMEADKTRQMAEAVADYVLTVYQDAAEDGNPAAACNLGALYYDGRTGEQSYEKAVEYYTIAAEGGDRQAAENLGYCYYYGRTGEPDYEKAFHYFALGAFDGHLVSLYKIGDMYRYGYYVPKNEKEAFYIYSYCANTMTPAAEPLCGADVYMRLADCFADGIGTEKLPEPALQLYQKAEQLFYDRLKNGDFMIRKNYLRCIKRQNELRQALADELPGYEWTDWHDD